MVLTVLPRSVWRAAVCCNERSSDERRNKCNPWARQSCCDAGIPDGPSRVAISAAPSPMPCFSARPKQNQCNKSFAWSWVIQADLPGRPVEAVLAQILRGTVLHHLHAGCGPGSRATIQAAHQADSMRAQPGQPAERSHFTRAVVAPTCPPISSR